MGRNLIATTSDSTICMSYITDMYKQSMDNHKCRKNSRILIVLFPCTGLYALHINLYLHESFEQILSFDPMDYSPWSKREFQPKLKRSTISKTEEAIPTKIGLHAFQIYLYLHEFFELIIFFDPHGLWSKGKFWLFLKPKKDQNLWNQRGHTHQN